MTRSLPNEPLWPRALANRDEGGGDVVVQLVAPEGNGTDAAATGPGPTASRRPKPTGPRSGTRCLLVDRLWRVGRESVRATRDRGRAEPLDAIEDRCSRSSRRSSMSSGKTYLPPAVRTPNAIATA